MHVTLYALMHATVVLREKRQVVDELMLVSKSSITKTNSINYLRGRSKTTVSVTYLFNNVQASPHLTIDNLTYE